MFEKAFQDQFKKILVRGVFLCLCSFYLNISFAADLVVTNSSDSGQGTLREALFTANNSQEATTIEFRFDPENTRQDEDGKFLIRVITPLPSITSEHPLTIRGGKKVSLDGASTKSKFPGLTIESSGHNITGLTIQNFGEGGILIHGSDSKNIENIHIADNHILDNGIYDEQGNSGDGIRIAVNVTNCYIYDNLIARNRGNGIRLQSLTSAVWSNYIFGNYISSNQKNGLVLEGSRNLVGIDPNNEPGPNIIILNNLHGILLNGSFGHGNTIAYSYIGVGPDMKPKGNRLEGVHLKSGAKNNTIGPALKIFHNGGGVVIRDHKSFGNVIKENEILANKAEGIYLENIAPEPVTKAWANTIQENATHGIKVVGASPQIWENQINSNDSWGIHVGVYDDANTDLFNNDNIIYSTPSIEGNHIKRNKLGGLYSLDTIYQRWDEIEKINTFSKNYGPDAKVDWKYLFSFTPSTQNFGIIDVEIDNCTIEGDSCSGRETREENGLYYIGPEKNFTLQDYHTFFTVTHFTVNGKFRNNRSPHAVTVTGDDEKSFLLSDTERASKILYKERKLTASVLSEDPNTNEREGPVQQIHIGTLGIDDVSFRWIWFLGAGLILFFLYHFWLAGYKVQGKQGLFDVGLTDHLKETEDLQ